MADAANSATNSTLSASNTGNNNAQVSSDANKRTIELKAQEELRFEVGEGETFELTLINGKAEIFGVELVLNQTYTFYEDTSLACFTYHGATLEITHISDCYVAGDTPMNQYLETHMLFEEQRNKAGTELKNITLKNEMRLNEVVRGPRIMIAGPTDSGKSSICKILLNYATRMRHKLLFLDMDVGQNQIVIPGAMAIAPVTEPIDITEEFDFHSPICFFFGHETPSKNVKHYKMLVDHMGEIVKHKCVSRQEYASGGFIINTCGWVEKVGYEILKHIVQSLQIDYILVMGDDKLSSLMKKDFSQQNISVLTMKKSGGVITRSKEFRSKARMKRIKQYFYGVRGTLSPHSITIKFNEVIFCRIGSATKAPASALPIGQKSVVDPCEVVSNILS
jgi:polyribonucleotide 5'-hydroxyl-kinase